MFRTFDLARIKALHIGAWFPAISGIVKEHLEKTAHLQQYGYGKTNLSNVEKNTYYRGKYSAASQTLKAINFESDTAMEQLAALEETVRGIYVEFHNSPYLDTSLSYVEQVMIMHARQLMALLKQRMLAPTTHKNIDINEILMNIHNKVAVSCGIIVYGTIESIERIHQMAEAHASTTI